MLAMEVLKNGVRVCVAELRTWAAYRELHRWRLARTARLGLFREDYGAAYASPRWRTAHLFEFQ